MGGLGLITKGLGLLGTGATIGGLGYGGIQLYDAVSGAGKGFREKAYASGPDLDGNFSAGFIGNQFIDEDSDAFKQGYKDYAVRNNTALQQMKGVLGDKLQFDPTKTITENIELNRKAFNSEQQKIDAANYRLTPEYEERQETKAEEKRRYQDSLRRAEQNRLDTLKAQQDTLNFRMLQAQRENDRYYDRLEREDARLRREGYQSLGTGLAALAAAFTIV
jgi:outer membrane receptor for ferrienterochelin and colicin